MGSKVLGPARGEWQDRGDSVAERQAQGQAARRILRPYDVSQSGALPCKFMFPQVYYKTKNIFPNVRASSEVTILYIQVKESLSESTSCLPK